MTELFPLVLIGAVMYFIVLRPQQKRQQQVRQMLASMSVDDDVITIGGMYGTVVDLDDDSVDLRVSASGLVLRFQKGAIAKVVPVELDSEDSAEDSDAEAMITIDEVVVEADPAPSTPSDDVPVDDVPGDPRP